MFRNPAVTSMEDLPGHLRFRKFYISGSLGAAKRCRIALIFVPPISKMQTIDLDYLTYVYIDASLSPSLYIYI